MQTVQEKMAYFDSVRLLFHVERYAMDPILHNRQYCHQLLQCVQFRGGLDFHDLYGHLYSVNISRLLVAG